jgi:hypothetical protein
MFATQKAPRTNGRWVGDMMASQVGPEHAVEWPASRSGWRRLKVGSLAPGWIAHHQTEARRSSQVMRTRPKRAGARSYRARGRTA